MEDDKNPQQIDWGDSMDDWDSQSWAEHTRYGGDDDPDTDYTEDPAVNDDFEYWRALKEGNEYSRRNAKSLEPKKRDKALPDKDDRDEKYWDEMDDLSPDYPE